MTRQHFTVNPSFPHPDSEGDPPPWPLDDSIIYALKALRNPNATQWERTQAADQLAYSFESQDDMQ